MKWTGILYLAPAVSAFSAPDQQVFQDIVSETKEQAVSVFESFSYGLHNLVGSNFFGGQYYDSVWGTEGSDLGEAEQALEDASGQMTRSSEIRDWLENELPSLAPLFGETELSEDDVDDEKEKPGKHRKHHRHHRDDRPPHHRPPRRGHHGNPHQTIFQAISESKYTTKFAEVLSDYPDLIEKLNSTKANYTLFVPVNAAFEKIPSHHKPSKEELEKILTYHVVPDTYPAFRVLTTHTFPSLLEDDNLTGEKEPLRHSAQLSFRGLTVDHFSRVIGANYFTKNGVIHGVDNVLVPLPNALKVVSLLPTWYSTLELGLQKSGINDELDRPHKGGGTMFAPNNIAFAKLGPRINGFLFSKYGEKYLKAVLQYHLVPNIILYSDKLLKGQPAGDGDEEVALGPKKGYKHYTLPTFLDDAELEVDVTRWGSWIGIRINGWTRVEMPDLIVHDGVIHEISNVLLPPRRKHGKDDDDEEDEAKLDADGYMTLEDFQSRFEPYLQ